MKFNVNSKDLLRNLKIVNSVIQNKCSLPILANVLFGQRDGGFTLTGSSPENSLTVPIAITLNAGDDFKPFCLYPVDLLPLLSSLADQPLTVEVNYDAHTVTFIYSSGKVTLPFEDADQYPPVAKMDVPKAQFDIATNIFLPATLAASANTAQDELRPVMMAVALDVNADEGRVTFVGTDGQSIYKYAYTHGVPLLKAGGDDLFLLPASVVKAVNTAFASAETITVTHDGKHICIEHEGVVFVIRDIEGKYPAYERVIPKDCPYHIVLPTKSLAAAVNRVRLMANDSTQMVKLAKEDMFLTLSASDYDFSKSANEELELAEVENPCTLPAGFAIGFKSTTLLKLLNVITTDNVRIELTSPSVALLIKEDAPNSALTELLMPMTLD